MTTAIEQQTTLKITVPNSAFLTSFKDFKENINDALRVENEKLADQNRRAYGSVAIPGTNVSLQNVSEITDIRVTCLPEPIYTDNFLVPSNVQIEIDYSYFEFVEIEETVEPIPVTVPVQE